MNNLHLTWKTKSQKQRGERSHMSRPRSGFIFIEQAVCILSSDDRTDASKKTLWK